MPGRCRLGLLNLEGDGQGDLAGHGGEQRAVFVYQIESLSPIYGAWSGTRAVLDDRVDLRSVATSVGK